MGKRAKVTKVYKDGDVIVTISGQSWTLNPDLLSAVSQVIKWHFWLIWLIWECHWLIYVSQGDSHNIR